MGAERRGSALSALVGLVLLAALLPGGALFVRNTVARPSPSTRQVQEPPADGGDLSAAAAAAADGFAPFTGAVPVLTYHGVGDGAGEYSLSPQQFASQMDALDRAGFHSVTLQQVVDLAVGRPVDLPPDPVLITFDDGIAGTWQRADPILAAHGFVATVFVVPDRVGNVAGSYYLTWDTLREMIASGRWSVGSHSFNGHRMVPTESGQGPFLTNREVSADGPTESIEGWEARVTDDLRTSRQSLEQHLNVAVDTLAYPFSAAGTPTNDERIPDLLPELVRTVFTAAFINTDDPVAVAPGQDLERLPRLASITAAVTPEELLARLDRAVPRPPPGDPSGVRWSGSPGAICDVSGSNVAVTTAGYARCLPVIGNESLWRDYTLTATVTGVDRGVTALLGTRVEGDRGMEVAIGESRAVVRASVDGSWTELASMRFTGARPSREVSIDVSGTVATIEVSGAQRVVVELPAGIDHGLVGLGATSAVPRSVRFDDVALAPH